MIGVWYRRLPDGRFAIRLRSSLVREQFGIAAPLVAMVQAHIVEIRGEAEARCRATLIDRTVVERALVPDQEP